MPKLQIILNYVRKMFLNHMLLAVYAGVTLSVLPTGQELIYADDGVLRPVGDALQTLAQPTVAIQCLIMAASLALTFKSAKVRACKLRSNKLRRRLLGTPTDSPVTLNAFLTWSDSPFVHPRLR